MSLRGAEGRFEAMGRRGNRELCRLALPVCDCFVPRNDN
jgi:hypothetical protein